MFEDIAEIPRNYDSGCKTTECKEIDVTVPITIEPYACIGDACVEIIDDPCIIPVPKCMRKHNCQYAIKQKLCVVFPIEFNAVATTGQPTCSLGENCDIGCDCECNCYSDCEELIVNELKEKVKSKLGDKIKQELKKSEERKPKSLKKHRNIESEFSLINTNFKKVIEMEKSEDELETLFSYKKLGNNIEILL